MNFLLSTIPFILAGFVLVFVESRDIQFLGLSINMMLYVIQIYLSRITEIIENKK
jgi:hypothetical protein